MLALKEGSRLEDAQRGEDTRAFGSRVVLGEADVRATDTAVSGAAEYTFKVGGSRKKPGANTKAAGASDDARSGSSAGGPARRARRGVKDLGLKPVGKGPAFWRGKRVR
jgi:hypothetical protein